MQKIVIWGCAVVLMLAAAPVARAGAPAADREGWPATRAGQLAHRWVAAFDAGEKEMKACLADIMAADALTKKPILSRVERYRDLKERFGSLTLVSVDKNEAASIEVTLAAADLSTHHFVFHLEPKPPYKLEQVGMMEGIHAGLGSFFHH
jgi:hypothetical protein